MGRKPRWATVLRPCRAVLGRLAASSFMGPTQRAKVLLAIPDVAVARPTPTSVKETGANPGPEFPMESAANDLLFTFALLRE